MMASPFRSVFVTDADVQSIDLRTHLVVMSPAVPDCRPDRLPDTTLCGLAVERESGELVGDVECADCLYRAQRVMDLPPFPARAR